MCKMKRFSYKMPNNPDEPPSDDDGVENDD